MFASSYQLYLFALRDLERMFGAQEFDVAGDFILSCVALSGADRVNSRFHFDTSHPNKWYHYLGLSISGLTEKQAVEFEHALVEAGLDYSK